MRLLGAILAGGRSRRFGSDKALALLDGRALLDHAAAALGALVEGTVVCGRAQAGDLPAIPDRPAPDLGPLGGLCAALHHAAANGFDAVLTLPCDTPLLPPGLLARVATAPCYVAQTPVIGCWPAALAPQLDAFLRDSDNRSVRRWAEVAGVRAIDAGQDIPNVNRPADLTGLQ